MLDLTLQQVVFRILAFLVVTGVFGFALAGMARLLGDRGPAYDGHLTPSPFPHLDLLGAVGAILFQLGWTRPMSLDPAEMRLGRLGPVVAVLGALAATLAVAWLLLLLQRPILGAFNDSIGLSLIELLRTVARISAWFAVANLIPTPPFAGSHILAAVVPALRPQLARVHVIAGLVVLAIAATGILTRVLRPAFNVIANFLLG